MSNRAGPNHPVHKAHPNQIDDIRKGYGFENLERLNEAIDILDAWTKKQNHFIVKDFDRSYLESFLINSKGSVEKAKKRLDKRVTLRNMIPDIFDTDLDNLETFLKTLPKGYKYAELPIPTKDYYRVVIEKPTANGFDDGIHFARFMHTVAEYDMINDYVIGYEYIVDTTDASISELISKLGSGYIRKFITMMIDGFGTKLKLVHIISSSKLVDIFVSLLKQGLSEKIANRFQLHTSYHTLHKFIDKEILPLDYDGTAPSLQELHDILLKELTSKNHIERMKLVKTFGTDESKRVVADFNDEYMGKPGSFRTMTVD